ncbi:reverse transcriptase domain-containing protein [Tanacetum coccineum]
MAIMGADDIPTLRDNTEELFMLNNKQYYIDIIESKPKNAITTIDTDCEVTPNLYGNLISNTAAGSAGVMPRGNVGTEHAIFEQGASARNVGKPKMVEKKIANPVGSLLSSTMMEPVPQDPGRPIFDKALREYCDRNYHHILPIIAKKVHQEKAQQEKLKVVKARLNFEETSHHSESGTPIKRRGLKERLKPRYVRSKSGSPEQRCGRPESPKKKGSDKNAVFKRLEKGVFHRLGDKGKSVSVYSDDSWYRSYHSSHRDTESCHQSSRSRTREHASERRYNKRASSKRTEELSESEGSAGETYPFTPRIRYFDFPNTRMPSHIKTYDGSEDPKDHLKIFQSAAKTERWAMPTWCHMFNSTLTGNVKVWFDDLLKETIDSYDDLKKAFLENYLQ